MNIIIQCEICKTIWIMQCNEMHHTTGGRDHCLQSAMLFNALMQWNVLWIVHMSNDMCRSNNTYIVFSLIRGLKRDRCLLTRELQCNAMEWAIHPLWIVHFNETFITSALKCAMQYNTIGKAMIKNSLHHEWWPVPQCSPVKIKLLGITIWYSKHLTKGFRNFSLALNISESYFEPWNL